MHMGSCSSVPGRGLHFHLLPDICSPVFLLPFSLTEHSPRSWCWMGHRRIVLTKGRAVFGGEGRAGCQSTSQLQSELRCSEQAGKAQLHPSGLCSVWRMWDTESSSWSCWIRACVVTSSSSPLYHPACNLIVNAFSWHSGTALTPFAAPWTNFVNI